METEGSLNKSMNSAKRHYSSLFSLPSLKTALSTIAAVCIVLVGLFTFALFPTTQGLADGLVLGTALFALTFAADLVMSKIILDADPIYTLRRTSVLSLFGWALWFVFIVIGVGLGSVFGLVLWVKLCILGFAVVVTLRSVVLFATSSAAAWRKLISVLLNPVLSIVGFSIFWAVVSSSTLIQVLPIIVIAPVVACAASFLFLLSLDKLGEQTYGIRSMPLFRAFMVNWVADLNAPLEEHLEKMGQNADIEVNLIKFDSAKTKAAIIVPQVHPGPFKNIGSSLLPSLLKQEFDKAFSCDACVPLGILGHELDLASQAQNHKIISQVIAAAKFTASADSASSFVKANQDNAATSCQIFGDTALLSFTLAPKTTEDLPQELGRVVREEAERLGLKSAIVINAHNSLTNVEENEVSLDALRLVAAECLRKAVALPKKPFMVGAATVFPSEFSLKDGMGTGGITAIVVQVENQKTAYVVIDGNNIVSGLREKILAALAFVGFDECEVFTTDTHAVTARVTGQQGYNPVGKAMDQALLIGIVCDVAKKAAGSLEFSKAGYLRLVVPEVRVIGEERLKSITTLVDKAIQRAKKMVLPVFGTEALILLLLLLLF